MHKPIRTLTLKSCRSLQILTSLLSAMPINLSTVHLTRYSMNLFGHLASGEIILQIAKAKRVPVFTVRFRQVKKQYLDSASLSYGNETIHDKFNLHQGKIPEKLLQFCSLFA